MAGGLGTRIQTVTGNTSKLLLSIAGKPLVIHAMEKLKACGIQEVVVILLHKAEEIKTMLGDGKKFGMNITYVIEPKKTSLGNALRYAKEYIGKEDFLMYFPDIFTTDPLKELKAIHLKKKNFFTPLVLKQKNPVNKGVVHVGDGKVTGIFPAHDTPSVFVDSGIGCYSAKIFDYLTGDMPDLYATITQQVRENESSSIVELQGEYVNINTPEEYERACAMAAPRGKK